MAPGDIMSVLRQRYPFLLVDKVLHMEYQKGASGIKHISMNEPWVPGHFPGEPIYPGVLIIETMAQIGGFSFYKPGEELKGYLIGADKVKLIRKVLPGDTLYVEATVTDLVGRFARASCVAKVGEEVVASGVISYAFE